ncbi:MAG: hypothetical protein LBU32_02455 [Clostridiales bacterium]|jgi:hypothetical protein|nr:hypothetical protein [Clostridiales bacterium]
MKSGLAAGDCHISTEPFHLHCGGSLPDGENAVLVFRIVTGVFFDDDTPQASYGLLAVPAAERRHKADVNIAELFQADRQSLQRRGCSSSPARWCDA